MQKTVRNVDEDVFEEAKKLASEKGLNMGDVVNRALLDWISSEKEPELDIMDFEPVEMSDEDENLSESYREELYG
jgi:antitoxin component of RelBE/YafQ-DinJ toxin-antitoxin module